jgi:Cu/Ag efflux protein CusF
MNAMSKLKLVTLSVALGIGCAAPIMAAPATAVPQEKTATGIATAIDPQYKTVSVKEFWGARRFNVANDCRVLLPNNPTASLADLRTGQKLVISYERDQGVLVAHQIAEKEMTFTGDIQSIDAAKHVMTVRNKAWDETYQIADDCKVVLHDEKSGTLSDAQPGDHVMVTFETPNGTQVAREIDQTSRVFTGTLTAIDQDERTLKAKTLLGTMKFNLGDDCKIVINGRTDGKLSDLRIGDQVVFNYEDARGVLVANRVGVGNTPSQESRPVVNNQNYGNPAMVSP